MLFKMDFTSVSVKPCPADGPFTCLASQFAPTHGDVTGWGQWCVGCEHRQENVYSTDKKLMSEKPFLFPKNISALLANMMCHFQRKEHKTRRMRLAGETVGYESLFHWRFGWNTNIWNSQIWDLLVKKHHVCWWNSVVSLASSKRT